MYQAVKKEDDEKVASKMPQPKGYKLLISPVEVDEKTEGGVYMPDALRDAEGIASIIGFVVSMGPDAYKDEKKFPTGPWCKKGQWVIFARYAGSRLPIEGGEVRLLNDDEVLGTIENPESVLHHI